jgi:SAM-dependent methyltransferase
MQGLDQPTLDSEKLRHQVEAVPWYHTLDLGNGLVTRGFYDHRPYLPYYGLPEDLTGKTALDVGAASGFFSFEMERRGAKVTAVDLPAWLDHDFGPCYVPDQTPEEGLHYLRDPILLARQALGSRIEKVEMTIYDLSPETVGTYDLVFCGSLLLHLTDPIRALWRLQSVTREQAIIATAIRPDNGNEPLALFVGHHRGDTWWLPNRVSFAAMVRSAGFVGWEWVSEFQLDYRDGRPGLLHAVIRAWNEPKQSHEPSAEQLLPVRPQALEGSPDLSRALAERDVEIARLRELIAGYERGRVMRLMTGIERAYRRLRAGRL